MTARLLMDNNILGQKIVLPKTNYFIYIYSRKMKMVIVYFLTSESSPHHDKVKLVNCCWMLGHVSFEICGSSTWVIAFCALAWFFSSVRKAKLISCWMFRYVLLERRGLSTWENAVCALVWFFSSVNAEVPFQMFFSTKWLPALFTMMWLLSIVAG